MPHKLLSVLFYLVAHTGVIAQDVSTDRWTDAGDETKITLPTSEAGRVAIAKDNPGVGGFNEFLRIQPTHSTREYIGFRNGTTSNNFVPVLLSYAENSAGSAMVLAAVTNPGSDQVINSPMMLFDTRTHTDNTLKTGAGSIVSRPLFAWRNYTTVCMQMLANGNLGLGITSPQAQLHTTGSVRFEGLAYEAGESVLMSNGRGNLTRFGLPAGSRIASVNATASSNVVPRFNEFGSLVSSQLTDNGNGIGIGGAPSNNAKLTLYGTMSLMSDARSKTNVVRMSNALQKVNSLNGYYYNWKDQQAGREAGFLAQEAEQVLPEAVSQNSEGTKFLNYDGILPLLTEAIKEQQKLIQSQSGLIEQLRREVDALKRKR